MIKNQTKIKFNLSGDSFFSNETLEIFPNRFNILYGRNGSGKSSISHAIATYAASPITESSNIEFIEPIAEEDKKHIFVFNENFIDKKVKVNQDGLNQIIMLGEQVELDLAIDECKDSINKIIDEKKSLENSLDESIEDSVANKLKIIKNNLIKQLSADGNWAERDGIIKENKIKSKVSDYTLQTIIENGKTSELLSKLSKSIEQGIDTIKQTKGEQPIIWSIHDFSTSIDINELNNILCAKIEKPELSDRDKAILKIIESQYGHYISKTIDIFNDENVNTCPLCLRPMTSDDKETSFQIVKKILNKDAENYKNRLIKEMRKFIDYPPSSISISVVKNNFLNNVKEVQIAIDAYNMVVSDAKRIIQERIDNIFQPFYKKIDANKFYTCVTDLQLALEKLKKSIKEYNQIIEKKEDYKKTLIEKNYQLAFKEYESSFREYNSLKLEIELNKQLFINKIAEVKLIQKKINELQAQKQQVIIALNFINQALSYVFFDKERLQLIEGDGCYNMLSRKHNVQPTKISIGERNIIALCYFFASIFKWKDEKDKYKEASLIIIDDPVSSFDFENRVGVISLLRWMSEKYLMGNANTKILIMTHDIQTAFNLQKVRKELDKDINFLELIDKKIIRRKGLHNEYRTIIVSVYEYACGRANESSSMIGNQMRKLMEAYSSFVYSKGFESISHDEEIINIIPENRQLYYKNLMTRLVLNGESHEEEAVYAMNLTDIKFTTDEKMIVAKSIIMFLYYINPKHITSYLPDGAIETINQWQNEGFDILEDT